MIAIACATTDELAFRARAAPVMEAIDDGGSLLQRRHGHEAVDEPYNEMLTVAAGRSDLEAVVFVHQDAVGDCMADVTSWVRSSMAADPDVAVLGAVDGGPPRELAMVDGTLLVLSAWAARELRFDPALGGSVDACAQDVSLRARAAGRRVLGVPLGVVRGSPERMSRPERLRQVQALAALRRKWGLDEAGRPRHLATRPVTYPGGA